MKISPKLVTIFVDDFAHLFSPKLVIFLVNHQKWWVIKWWKFHLNWWQYLLMILLIFFHQNWWKFCRINEIFKNLVTKICDNFNDLLKFSKIYSPKLVKRYSLRNVTNFGIVYSQNLVKIKMTCQILMKKNTEIGEYLFTSKFHHN